MQVVVSSPPDLFNTSTRSELDGMMRGGGVCKITDCHPLLCRHICALRFREHEVYDEPQRYHVLVERLRIALGARETRSKHREAGQVCFAVEAFQTTKRPFSSVKLYWL